MLPHVRRSDGEIPTSSMADIAFLLLIFFLVTTVFEEERGLPIVLPDTEEPLPVPANNVMHLIVRADGLVEVRAGASAFTRTVDAARIPSIWRDAHAENPLLIAALRTHPDAAYFRMIDVLDALRGAGAERVSLQELAGR